MYMYSCHESHDQSHDQHTHVDGTLDERPEHEEGRVCRDVVLQPQHVEGGNPVIIVVGVEMGREKTTKLDECIQTLRGKC